MRKRILTVCMLLVFVLGLVACSKEKTDNSSVEQAKNEKTEEKADDASSKTGASDDSQSSVKTDAGLASGNDEVKASSEEEQTSKDRPERNSGNTRASMENRVASYLADISDVEEISLCDGASFSYEPWSEWSIWGDEWTISQPSVSNGKEFLEILDKQLVDGSGFKKTQDLMGYVYYVNAGVEQLGIKVSYSFDDEFPEGNEITVAMTHAPQCYSLSYIDEMNAKMPKVIPFRDVREKLPESYQITFMKGTYEITIASRDGNYFLAEKDTDPDGWATDGWSYAYISNGDGTYTKMENYNYMSNDFYNAGELSEEEVMDELKSAYDFEGQSENGSLATWGQISTEYLDGNASSFLDDASWYFNFSTSFENNGAEEIAGVMCDTVSDNNFWSKSSFAFDPETGVTFRILRTEGEETTTLFEVKEYNTDPSSLGSYEG